MAQPARTAPCTAVPDGKSLATRLSRLLDIKDAAHYGVQFIAGQKAREAVTSARALVERATTEMER